MKSQTPRAPGESQQAGGKRIPDKPRDCGPHVDTWPILDTQGDDAPTPSKADADGKKPQ